MGFLDGVRWLLHIATMVTLTFVVIWGVADMALSYNDKNLIGVVYHGFLAIISLLVLLYIKIS